METSKYSPKEIKPVKANLTDLINRAQIVTKVFSLQDYGLTTVQMTTGVYNKDNAEDILGGNATRNNLQNSNKNSDNA